MKSLKMNKERIVLFLVLLVIFLCYLSQLTTSGLWFDEAIEYFYSKYVGALPETNGFDANLTNMYERICNTYQPPLYNVLMHFWLLSFDGEASFRLAGVLVTFVGAIGFFKMAKSLTDFKWATVSVTVYLMTDSIIQYGLECAEYNLMLCMEAWAMYYFVRFLNGADFKQRRNSLLGFLAFAVLAAYSQYGAVLLVVPLCVVMFIDIAKKGDKRLMVVMIASIVVVLIFFAAPLLYFFLIPQMEHQASLSVSHVPVFKKNVFYSLGSGVFSVLSFVFAKSYSIVWKVICVLFVGLVGLVSLAGLRNRNSKLAIFWSALAAVFLLYFILVACSFYAYSFWLDSFGCYNLGGRYTLYMAPLILITFLYGVYNFKESLISREKYGDKTRGCLWGVLLIFIIVGACGLFTIKQKSYNARDAYEQWEFHGGSKNYTVIENFLCPSFVYYFMHGKHYEEARNNVIGEGFWSREATPEEIYQKQDSIGVYKHDVVFVVVQNDYLGKPTLKNHDIAMRKAGYTPKFLLDRRNGNTASLIVYSK